MPRRATLALVLMVVFALFCFFMATNVRSHSWYPYACCSGNDCAAISEKDVRIVAGGYLVTVRPGTPPTVTKPRAHLIPYTALKVSPDGLYHICIDSTESKVLCFYGPIPGT